MRILLTLPRPLFPCDTGGRIRSLRIFQRLVKRLEIHALALEPAGSDPQDAEQMRKLFASYTPVPWNEAKRFSAGFYLEFARQWFGRYPFFLGKYLHADLPRAVAALRAKHHFDLLLCDFPHTAIAFAGSDFRPRVIFQHNVEHRIRKQHFQNVGNPLVKWVLKGEWKKSFEIEREVCREADHVITVSEEDRQAHADDFGIRHVSAIPTGVDADYFSPLAQPELPHHITFVASYDWFPNEDAALWFLNEVYPRIRAALPGVTFSIVGRRPTPAILDAAAKCEGVEVTGTVEDVRPYLARAELVIVPIRMGGGTRIKIFEAMAMKKAVVSTTIGAEGLPVTSGENILLADGAERFAEGILSLLQDAGRRNKIAHAARQLVVEKHSWEIVAQRMEEILRAVSGLKAQAAQSSTPVELPAALAE